VHSLQKFDSKEKFVWCCYLVVFIIQHFSILQTATCCTCFCC